MKTFLSGPVRKEHLDDAEFMAGITPTGFLTNGHYSPPVSNLPTEVDPPCPMLPGELGETQRNYTLLLRAEAVISVGGNPAVARIAKGYGLPIYESDE